MIILWREYTRGQIDAEVFHTIHNDEYDAKEPWEYRLYVYKNDKEYKKATKLHKAPATDNMIFSDSGWVGIVRRDYYISTDTTWAVKLWKVQDPLPYDGGKGTWDLVGICKTAEAGRFTAELLLK